MLHPHQFEDISENEPLWQKQLRKLQDSSPSHVELLSEVEALRFDTEGVRMGAILDSYSVRVCL